MGESGRGPEEVLQGVAAAAAAAKAKPTAADLRPLAIVEELDLLRPIYAPTAAYGHFGRTSAAGYDNAFPWEQTTKVEALRAAVRG